LVQLTDGPIEVDPLLQAAEDPACGAVVLFLGTTRRWTKPDRHAWTDATQAPSDQPLETGFLEYQAHRPMAVHQLERIEREARQRWDLGYVAIVHRLGRVDIGQASVAVVVASPHRDNAFEASRWIMDSIKKNVPIWKKEVWADHSSDWVHPRQVGA
jgi:molybdopterin synthase catalytic subunit